MNFKKEIFEKVKSNIQKYDSMFIDEVQDYKTEWLNILKRYFLNENAELVLYGDEKQNIYNTQTQPLDKKRIYIF